MTTIEQANCLVIYASMCTYYFASSIELSVFGIYELNESTHGERSVTMPISCAVYMHTCMYNVICIQTTSNR